ncbi:MAG: ubiquinol oxidase subunit II [Chlamydiales bacterium]|nr:ubiquinol oxidase subunit II [Chlamydiia bacterium]MCP5507895.1 ubiquinol oxidase subunit II [Chlamydiales bacterium]
MGKTKKAIFYWLLFSGIILLFILLMQPMEIYYLLHNIPVLFPKGMIAFKQRDLLLLIQAMMLMFVIPVYIFTFLFSWRYRADNKNSTYDPHLVDHKVAEFFWWGIPLVMTTIVCIITFYKTHELDPYKPIPSENKPLKVEVVALEWKWLFIYPEEKIATVNYLQIPKDTPINFHITADAPMNAFWIPDLGSMIYAMPGMRTQLNLIADQEGKFRGSSSQISGKGFAWMNFETIASSEAEFQDWVEKVKQSPKQLDKASYKILAEPTEKDPPAFFQLADDNLFEQIIMKFMMPNTTI